MKNGKNAGKVVTAYKLAAGKYDELKIFVKCLGDKQAGAAHKWHQELI